MIERVPVVGAGVDRVDGPRKVTGTAPYPNDLDLPDLAHAALVRHHRRRQGPPHRHRSKAPRPTSAPAPA